MYQYMNTITSTNNIIEPRNLPKILIEINELKVIVQPAADIHDD
jgi:hypothetical protein